MTKATKQNNEKVKLNDPHQGTETTGYTYHQVPGEQVLVKLNDPHQGTETSGFFISQDIDTYIVKLNDPHQGTETDFSFI